MITNPFRRDRQIPHPKEFRTLEAHRLAWAEEGVARERAARNREILTWLTALSLVALWIHFIVAHSP